MAVSASVTTQQPHHKHRLPSIHTFRSIEKLLPATETLRSRLVFVDVENVLAPFKGVSIDATGKRLIHTLRQNGASVILASNMTDHDRMEEIADQVPEIHGFVHKGMETVNAWEHLPSKSHAGMFEYGARMAGFSTARGSVLIDDQLKNIIGAREAGITDYFWLCPRFADQQDTRVRLGRVIEMPIGYSYARMQKYGRGIASVLRGDHGEW